MTEKTSTFRKEIRLFDAIMLVAGTMIGSGIFIVSADIARQVGSSGFLMLVWGITGLITVAGALSYGELAAMYPKSGGQYVFLREAYSPLVAFLYGWTLFLVIQTGTIAAVGVAFAKYTGVLIPFFTETPFFKIGNFGISTVQVLAIASIWVLTYMNLQGVKNGKFIQNLFGSTKIIALLGLIFIGILWGSNAEAIQANFSNMWQLTQTQVIKGQVSHITNFTMWGAIALIGTAMVGSLFSSDAWNNITFAGDEIVNPKRTLPLSLAIGTGLVTLLYLLANLVYLWALPLEGINTATTVVGKGIQFAENDRVATAVAIQIGGGIATGIMAGLIMISTFGCNNGCILSGARVYYAMGADGVFLKGMGVLNAKGVPAVGLITQAVWASVLCLSGNYGTLLDYVMFAVLLFYVLTIGGIFILRIKQPHLPRPYKAFGYPVMPALYIVCVTLICVILLMERTATAGVGLGIVLLGIPVYYIFLKK
ncbi:MAG: amino acid permease [Bacteroidetes bacterium]|nr:MAG: amino acid permease [Bacteroidota bacterium]